MRAQIALPVLAAAVLAGCAGASHPATVRHTQAAVASAPSYAAGDAKACQAFYDASTTGIPAGMAPPGTDTVTWLVQQSQGADPQLRGTIAAFANSFGQQPPDMTGVNLATAEIKATCKHYGF